MKYPRSSKIEKPAKLGRTDCDRCGGSGIYAHYGTCYRCGGRGTDPTYRDWVFPVAWTDAEIDAWQNKRAERNAKARERAEAKRAAKRDAIVNANLERFPDLADLIERAKSIVSSPFVSDVLGKRFRFELTEAQVAAVRDAIERAEAQDAERKAAHEAAAPCPTGRVEIVGEIVTVREQASDFGLTTKVLVKADAGFKVWGTVPRALFDWDRRRRFADRDASRLEGPLYGFKGLRVRFVATVEPSNDDPKFGFYKRPTKARVIEAA